MIEVEDKIISKDLFEKKFVCDLQQCKGACCVEGDSGAPLSKKEVDDIESNLSIIKEEMSPIGKKAIESKNFYYVDEDKEEVTSLVNGKECVFVFYDQNNIAKCSIESAYRKNKINFKPACNCGTNLNIPVFKFLKEPIIRVWGKEFYSQLDAINREFFQKDKTE